MSIIDISVIYNAVFIAILIIVCSMFSRIHLKIAGSFTKWRWAITSVYFVVVVFATIFGWHYMVGI